MLNYLYEKIQYYEVHSVLIGSKAGLLLTLGCIQDTFIQQRMLKKRSLKYRGIWTKNQKKFLFV